MSTLRSPFAAIAVITVCAILTASSNAKSRGPDPDTLEGRLIPIGQPGPQAIGLKVSTGGGRGTKYWPGDQVTINLRVNRKAYVTIMALSSKTGVAILIPNREAPSVKVEPGTTYKLFGKDSRVQMRTGKADPQSELAIFVSSNPLELAPLEIPKGRAYLTISPAEREELGVLRGKLEQLAKDKGFNRTVLSLQGPKGERMAPEAVLIPGKRRTIRLPGHPIESQPPGSTTGSQGRKMRIPDED